MKLATCSHANMEAAVALLWGDFDSSGFVEVALHRRVEVISMQSRNLRLEKIWRLLDEPEMVPGFSWKRLPTAPGHMFKHKMSFPCFDISRHGPE